MNETIDLLIRVNVLKVVWGYKKKITGLSNDSICHDCYNLIVSAFDLVNVSSR